MYAFIFKIVEDSEDRLSEEEVASLLQVIADNLEGKDEQPS